MVYLKVYLMMSSLGSVKRSPECRKCFLENTYDTNKRERAASRRLHFQGLAVFRKSFFLPVYDS